MLILIVFLFSLQIKVGDLQFDEISPISPLIIQKKWIMTDISTIPDSTVSYFDNVPDQTIDLSQLLEQITIPNNYNPVEIMGENCHETILVPNKDIVLQVLTQCAHQ
eukprot:NODE_723_length_4443_cov_1.043048.p5 type:complete len:107 gc:universal NODE_723_length_4443_cov_1.043048:3855-3535(-)